MTFTVNYDWLPVMVLSCILVATIAGIVTWRGYCDGWCPKWSTVSAHVMAVMADAAWLLVVLASQRWLGIWQNASASMLAILATIGVLAIVSDTIGLKKSIMLKSTKERDSENDQKLENNNIAGM